MGAFGDESRHRRPICLSRRPVLKFPNSLLPGTAGPINLENAVQPRTRRACARRGRWTQMDTDTNHLWKAGDHREGEQNMQPQIRVYPCESVVASSPMDVSTSEFRLKAARPRPWCHYEMDLRTRSICCAWFSKTPSLQKTKSARAIFCSTRIREATIRRKNREPRRRAARLLCRLGDGRADQSIQN